VIVDNRAGASGNIGAEAAARAQADGNTFFVSSSGVLAANQFLYKRTGFDTLKDFTPVIQLVIQPHVLLVHPSVPAKDLKELIALAKAQPARSPSATRASAPARTSPPASSNRHDGAKVLHVPYKGGAPALADLMGGQINAMFETSPTAVPVIKENKLRGVAITSAKRSPSLPNVPTVAEAGIPGFESVTWIGMVAPAGTPKAIVDRVNAELNKGCRATWASSSPTSRSIPPAARPRR
jgi:tripartite-type tricarboxylate transporter receptor subunit TctC